MFRRFEALVAALATVVFVHVAAQSTPSPGDAEVMMVRGRRYLERQGIEDYGDVFYHKRSQNVSLCMRHADATTRVIQICTVIAVADECFGSLQPYFFDRCEGRVCTARFTREETLCILEKTGVAVRLNATAEGYACSLPEGEGGLFEWQAPSWTLAVGDANHFDCLTALPAGTALERRLACSGDHPIVEHRLMFASEEFLKTDERKNVKCVASQECGLPSIFAGEVACYETRETRRGRRDAAESGSFVEVLSNNPEVVDPNGAVASRTSFVFMVVTSIVSCFSVIM